jgi:hypothetical protein
VFDITLRRLLWSATATATFAAVVHAAGLKPINPTMPIFRIFAPVPAKAQTSSQPDQLSFDDRHPLLVVRSVTDVVLGRDNKSVAIRLNPTDAKKFGEITTAYKGRLLLFEANGQVLSALQIIAPNGNGLIGFKHPEEEAIAQYLRRRFRLAEFK